MGTFFDGSVGSCRHNAQRLRRRPWQRFDVHLAVLWQDGLDRRDLEWRIGDGIRFRSTSAHSSSFQFLCRRLLLAEAQWHAYARNRNEGSNNGHASLRAFLGKWIFSRMQGDIQPHRARPRGPEPSSSASSPSTATATATSTAIGNDPGFALAPATATAKTAAATSSSAAKPAAANHDIGPIPHNRRGYEKRRGGFSAADWWRRLVSPHGSD